MFLSCAVLFLGVRITTHPVLESSATDPIERQASRGEIVEIGAGVFASIAPAYATKIGVRDIAEALAKVFSYDDYPAWNETRNCQLFLRTKGGVRRFLYLLIPHSICSMPSSISSS